MPIPDTDTRRKALLLFLILAAAVIIILSSCVLIKPRGRVILKPSALRPLPGDRPWLFVRYLPYSYRDYIVEIDTPGGGGAYLLVGPALSSTYSNALGAYFSVNYISTKGVGQMAFADFDLMEFRSSIEDLQTQGQDRRRVRLALSLSHFIRMFSQEGLVIEDIPLEVSVDGVIEYTDTEDFVKGAESLTADLLLMLEAQLFDHVHQKGREGIYVPYGSHRPSPIPDFGPGKIMQR